ncbi:MAG: MFS transporter [Dehalococcoidia bacterium]
MNRELTAPECGFLASLHLRDFRYVWTSSMLSGSGQWTLIYARGWLMQRLTGSAGWVGVTVFASMIPYLFATPIGGVLADRFDRRKLSAAMQSVTLLASVVLGVLAIWGVVQPWEIVALAVFAGVGRAMETPATTSLIPTIVPQTYLLNAISLSSVATFGSQFLGPLAAWPLLAHGMIGEVFIMTAALYAIAMALILCSKAPAVMVRMHENPWRETVTSWKYIAGASMLPMIVLLGALHCGLTMTKDSILPSFVTNVLHGGGSTLSLLGMGFGAGTMVGTFALGGLRTEEAKGPLFLITGLASGLAVSVLAFTGSALPAFLALSVMGASQAMFMALGSTLIQQVVPDQLRGRVTSGYLMATGGVMSFGNLGAGAFADSFGVRAVLLIPSLLFVAVLLALTAVRPGLRLLYRTGVLPDTQPAPVVSVAVG